MTFGQPDISFFAFEKNDYTSSHCIILKSRHENAEYLLFVVCYEIPLPYDGGMDSTLVPGKESTDTTVLWRRHAALCPPFDQAEF